MEDIVLEIYSRRMNVNIDVSELEGITLDMEHGFDSLGIVEFIVEVSTEVEAEVDVLLEKFFSSMNLLEFTKRI